MNSLIGILIFLILSSALTITFQVIASLDKVQPNIQIILSERAQ